jgi:hypothetical protein
MMTSSPPSARSACATPAELPRRRCCCRDDCRRRRRIASPAAATLLGCRTKSFQRDPAKRTSRPIARHRSGAAIVFRFIDEQAAQPIRRSAAFRKLGGCTWKPLAVVRKHARSRPLLRPQADPSENPFVAPHKFPEAPTMIAAGEFFARKFPRPVSSFFDLALVLVGGHEFARVHASLRQFLRE